MKIGNNIIGEKVYVIAEAGVNHNGDLDRAKELIRKAAQCGADAIKFQTYTADELVVKGTPKFWNAKVDEGKDQYQAYQTTGGFPYEWYPELIKVCEENNIEFLSTPFSFEAANFLNELGMKAFKIASSDLSTLPFLEHIAKFGKPIILSTGASTLEEIHEAVDTITDAGNDQIILLHCTLCYPTKSQDVNLNLINTLKREFPRIPVGISDHTLTTLEPILAAAMGAIVVEKHFTLDKSLPNSADHWLSLNPDEFKSMVHGIRVLEMLKGSSEKKIFDCEKETRVYDKRSIVSNADIKKGDVITESMITYKRPGTGIWPKYKKVVIGRTAEEDILKDTTLTWNMLSKTSKQ